MKKIIIAACMALLGCGSVFAQQGKQAIGGNLRSAPAPARVCYDL